MTEYVRKGWRETHTGVGKRVRMTLSPWFKTDIPVLVIDNTPEAREKMADDIMVPVLDWGSEYCDSEAVPDVEAAIERILTTLLGPPVEPEP
jgi:hypothetical protein